MPGLVPVEVVAAQVDDHQHRPLQRRRAFVDSFVAAQIDHRGHVAHFVQLIDVRLLAADDDRAGRACRSCATTRPVTPGTYTSPVFGNC